MPCEKGAPSWIGPDHAKGKDTAMRLHDFGFLIIAAGICAAVALIVASQVA